jgi:hypothetical protein
MNTTMIGLDIAKNVFEIYGTGAGGDVFRRRLRRAEVERYFTVVGPAVVGLGSVWGRALLGTPVTTAGTRGADDAAELRGALCQA